MVEVDVGGDALRCCLYCKPRASRVSLVAQVDATRQAAAPVPGGGHRCPETDTRPPVA
jgi:hypothetical protein